jgi:hypothetical protein
LKKKFFIILIFILFFISFEGNVSANYDFKSFQGFVYNVTWKKNREDLINDSECYAISLIGKISYYNTKYKVDEEISMLQKIQLRNIFIPPPYRIQPRLYINYWLNKTIIFPIWINGIIVE